MGGTVLGRLVAIDRSSEPELLDRPDHDLDLLAGNFRDIERVNRWLGGSRLTIRALRSLLGNGNSLPTFDSLSVLDVGSGSGDIPAAVRGWATRQGMTGLSINCDLSPAILRLSRSPERLLPVAADGRALPLRSGQVDVACCSLVIHHLEPSDAISLLREMARVSRRGVVVNDLVRGRVGYAGSLLLSRLTTRNRLTRHDAPLSVRRAYTRAELLELFGEAGLEVVASHAFLGYRVALAARSAQ
jgi:ubiquinone/menaquinone biosynthesis C-methylase UbiE